MLPPLCRILVGSIHRNESCTKNAGLAEIQTKVCRRCHRTPRSGVRWRSQSEIPLLESSLGPLRVGCFFQNPIRIGIPPRTDMRWSFWRKQMRRLMIRTFLMVTLLVALSASLRAQQTGSIVGTVTDKTGAVVSHAKATLINMATKDVRVTSANAEGFFAFSGVVSGDYSVR